MRMVRIQHLAVIEEMRMKQAVGGELLILYGVISCIYYSLYA